MTDDILYINATVRSDSRTAELASCLLGRLDGNITELKLEKENLMPLNREALEKRDFIISNNDRNNEMLKYARQFANADIIVIAAPFWDYSFPAILKTYIENISVYNTTFTYDESGMAVGLCKAKKVYYVSTSGGKFVPDYGYGYIKRLFNDLYQINDVELIYAEGLDIVGNDARKIIDDTKEIINKKEI